MSETDLLPCPFCGGEAQLVSHSNWRHYVRCMCCPQQFEQGLKSDAIAAWNARPAMTDDLEERIATALHECSAQIHEDGLSVWHRYARVVVAVVFGDCADAHRR